MIEELANGKSFIKQLDPRVKVAVVFLFSIVLAVATRPLVLVLGLFLGLLVVLTARVPANEVFKRLIPVNTLVFFLWFFLPFTFGGKPLTYIGPLIVTKEGVLYAMQISIKSNAIMLMLIALVATTPIFTIGHALNQLKIPPKIVHLFLFTYRYIHVIYREYSRMLNSLKIRCFKPKTNLHTYKTFAYMVGMLLVRSFDRAQRVHNAMLCRGFKGNLHSLSRFSFKRKDLISLIFMITAIILLGVLEWNKTI